MELILFLSKQEIMDSKELSNLIKRYFNAENIEEKKTSIAFKIFKRAYKKIKGEQELSNVIKNLTKWEPRFHASLAKTIKKFILNTVTATNWTGKRRNIDSLVKLEDFMKETAITFQVELPTLREIIEEMLKEENYKKVINRPKHRKRYLKILKEAADEGVITLEEFKKVLYKFIENQEKEATRRRKDRKKKAKKQYKSRKKVKQERGRKQKNPREHG